MNRAPDTARELCRDELVVSGEHVDDDRQEGDAAQHARDRTSEDAGGGHDEQGRWNVDEHGPIQAEPAAHVPIAKPSAGHPDHDHVVVGWGGHRVRVDVSQLGDVAVGSELLADVATDASDRRISEGDRHEYSRATRRVRGQQVGVIVGDQGAHARTCCIRRTLDEQITLRRTFACGALPGQYTAIAMPAPSPSGLVLGTWIDTEGRRTQWSDTELASDVETIEHEAGRLEHGRILIVEDEHLVALDLQVRLKHMGHQPDVAYSGEEAVEKAAKDNFDLVLMDIKLKGALDGIEAARTIRQAADVPIIYLTAYADNHTLDRARYTEPYGYILTPFQERELKAAIERALRRHAHDKLRAQQQVLERFLAEASAHMATSLDYRAVARSTAELIVPRYADWCLIHLREAQDQVPAFSYAQPAGDDRAVTSPLIETVERIGRPEMNAAFSGTAAYRDAFGAQHVDTLREIGARGLMCVPLLARDRVLGSLALVAGKTRARYSASDLAFVEDLARRLAMSLDNALLYRRAERAILMRDDVLAVVSHDLRTPLSTILMQAEMLTSHPELGRVGHAIARAAQRMNRLIGDLLDASAINSGQLALEVGVHEADGIIHEAAEPFRSMAETRGITLEEIATPEVGSIRCDRDRVLQALSNLIDNALRFTPRGGRVCVAARRGGDGIELEVQDTGRGIPAEQLPHLFDRFWRGQARRGGAGLGLFITKGIVGAHDSALEVESTVNVGSRFHFTLRAGS